MFLIVLQLVGLWVGTAYLVTIIGNIINGNKVYGTTIALFATSVVMFCARFLI